MALKVEYTSEEYILELDRQGKMAQALTDGCSEVTLNWQPNSGKSWSIAQCLDQLAIMNAKYVKALHDAVAGNEDQLEPPQSAHPALRMVDALVIGTEEPPPRLKLPAPKKIQPPSKLTCTVVQEFCGFEQQLADFVREWGEADLGELTVKDPLFPLRLSADMQLLMVSYHNR